MSTRSLWIPPPASPPSPRHTPAALVFASAAQCRVPSFLHRASVGDLQSYFKEHQVQERLNVWLGELVQERPAKPYQWLAQRMRTESANGAVAKVAPATTPQVSKAVGAAEVGGQIASTWRMQSTFSAPAALKKTQGSTKPAATAAAPAASDLGAAARAPAVSTVKGLAKEGLELSIECLCDGALFLAIRDSK